MSRKNNVTSEKNNVTSEKNNVTSGVKRRQMMGKMTSDKYQNNVRYLVKRRHFGIVFINISFIKVSKISLNTIFLVDSFIYFSKSLRGR